MLMKVLACIANSKGLSIQGIADKVGISKELVEQMIDNLIQMGYIRRVGLSCDTSKCKGCASSSSCGSTGFNNLTVMELTEKGKKTVTRL